MSNDPSTPPANLAVVLSCHGTVEKVEDIPAFVRNIRRGRPAPPEVIEEVTSRFEQIGGSPMMRITHEQAAALEERLGLPVRATARLWEPYAGPVLDALREEGIERILSLPLAPQSVHVYNAVVEEEAEARELEVIASPSWGEEPELVAAFVEAIDEARSRFADAERESLAVVLTAHSLPTRILAAGDPYEKDFRAMADVVSRALVARGVAAEHIHVAFQSQGMGGGDWLGPDLEQTFSALASAGTKNLLVAPIGFLAEHVETLYDIDIEAKQMAHDLGIERLERMPAMNTRPAFIDALEAVARRLLPS
ncbi:MAG TPA: ferrochelatase [Polyangiaceae bacterium]|nr:ferrochelatase [Polyangiaceae bacterium]